MYGPADDPSIAKSYAARGRLHLGEREELMRQMVDDWWTARANGEAVMQASSWRDVVELNEWARERLDEAGVVEREGLEVGGVTVSVGDHMMVLRNAPALGIINGTMGTVTAIDRDNDEIVLEREGPAPDCARYCRTIHIAGLARPSHRPRAAHGR
jgi:ATP-dependent exoDNAse (exonuclease V) alpha subunit